MLTLAKASSPGIYLFYGIRHFSLSFLLFLNSPARTVWQLKVEKERTQRTQERTQYKDSQTQFSGNEDNTGEEGVSLLNVSCLITNINDQWLSFQKVLSFEKSKFE